MDPREDWVEPARRALESGRPEDAYDELRFLLRYPGYPLSTEEWTEVLELFARAVEELGMTELPGPARAVAENPDDPQALFDFGYVLMDHDLHRIAAPVLVRAERLSPGDDRIVEELAYALEGDGRFAEARAVLERYPEMTRARFHSAYLLAFYALMSGDLEAPRRALPELCAREDVEEACVDSLRRFLARADGLRGVAPLDREDVRGWHYVVTGGILLHRSPHRFAEMHGRYAIAPDSEELCLEGLVRMKGVLEALAIRPLRVFALADEPSAILAHAAGGLLGLPVARFPEEGASEPGLIPVYDLSYLAPAERDLLVQHHRHQVVWEHASCWTTDANCAGDLTTFLCQMSLSPWGGWSIDPAESGAVPFERPTPPGSVPERANRVLEAKLAPEVLEDLPELTRFARAVAGIRGMGGPAATRSEGLRDRQWLGSVVQSERSDV